MAVTVWSSDKIKIAHGCVLASQAEVSVGVWKDGNTIKLLFKFSQDGQVWPSDAEAVEIGTIPKVVAHFIRATLTGALVVGDGKTELFRSLKGGKAGSWNPA